MTSHNYCAKTNTTAPTKTSFKFTSDSIYKEYITPKKVIEAPNDEQDVINKKNKHNKKVQELENKISNLHIQLINKFDMLEKQKEQWRSNSGRMAIALEIIMDLFYKCVRKARFCLGDTIEGNTSCGKAKECLLDMKSVEDCLKEETFNDFTSKIKQIFCERGFDYDIPDDFVTQICDKMQEGLYSEFSDVLSVDINSGKNNRDSDDVIYKKFNYLKLSTNLEERFQKEWTNICKKGINIDKQFMKSRAIVVHDMIKTIFELSARYTRSVIGEYKSDGEYILPPLKKSPTYFYDGKFNDNKPTTDTSKLYLECTVTPATTATAKTTATPATQNIKFEEYLFTQEHLDDCLADSSGTNRTYKEFVKRINEYQQNIFTKEKLQH